MKTLLILPILFLLAPRFLRDMPKPAKGLYHAKAYTQSHWYKSTKASEVVNGRLRAYIRARWLALKVDWSMPSGGRWDEIGVTWEVIKS